MNKPFYPTIRYRIYRNAYNGTTHELLTCVIRPYKKRLYKVICMDQIIIPSDGFITKKQHEDLRSDFTKRVHDVFTKYIPYKDKPLFNPVFDLGDEIIKKVNLI